MTAAQRIADKLEVLGAARSQVRWPSVAWRGQHRRLVRDVLGLRSMTAYQLETMDAYCLERRADITECTGQKLGKTEKLQALMLYDFATEPALNGLLFAPKIDWINEAFWARFAKMAMAAFLPCAACMPAHKAWLELIEDNPLDETPRPERCSKCSPLVPSELVDRKDATKGRRSDWIELKDSEKGLCAPDGRMIRGYASRKLGGHGGFSGRALRVYNEEGSDIPDEVYDSQDGNLVGGGKRYTVGNMLRRTGRFYRAFRDEKGRYTRTFQRSSRLSPNCPGRIEWPDGVTTCNLTTERPIPGLATREGVEKNIRDWLGSDLIASRIDGEAPDLVDGQLVAASVVQAAERRWTADDDEQGILQLGVDVARRRDPIVLAFRRGRKVFRVHSEVLGEDDHARGVELSVSMLLAARRPHERQSRLVYDQTGPEGQKFKKEIDLYFALHPELREQILVVGIVMGSLPRQNRRFSKRRDELICNFADWLKVGAVPPSTTFEAEMDATTIRTVKLKLDRVEWEVVEVISNDDLRKMLGHSPNERDACMLAVLDLDGSEQQSSALAPQEAPLGVRKPSLVQERELFLSQPNALNMHDRLEEVYRNVWGTG